MDLKGSLRPVLIKLEPEDIEVLKAEIKKNHGVQGPECSRFMQPHPAIRRLKQEPQVPERSRLRRRRSAARQLSEEPQGPECSRPSRRQLPQQQPEIQPLKQEPEEQDLQIGLVNHSINIAWSAGGENSSDTGSMDIDTNLEVKNEVTIEEHPVELGENNSPKQAVDKSPKGSCEREIPVSRWTASPLPTIPYEYPCYKCNMVFSKSNILMVHVRSHQARSSLPASFSFQRKSGAFGRATHSASKKLHYKCRYCERRFSHSYHRKAHERAFYRHNTCDRNFIPKKKVFMEPADVQHVETKSPSGKASNLLGFNSGNNDPIKDQNFVRAMMMHVAPTAEDCFLKTQSERCTGNNENGQCNEENVVTNRNTTTVSQSPAEEESIKIVVPTAKPSSQDSEKQIPISCSPCKKTFRHAHYYRLHCRAQSHLLKVAEIKNSTVSTVNDSVTDVGPLLKRVHNHHASLICQPCHIVPVQIEVQTNNGSNENEELVNVSERTSDENFSLNSPFRELGVMKNCEKDLNNSEEFSVQSCRKDMKTEVEMSDLKKKISGLLENEIVKCGFVEDSSVENGEVPKTFEKNGVRVKLLKCNIDDSKSSVGVKFNLLSCSEKLVKGEKDKSLLLGKPPQSNKANVVKVSCRRCGKLFTKARALRTHLRIHSNDGVYKCFICQNKFKVMMDLQDHVKAHFKEGTRLCGICRKRLPSLSLMIKHSSVHKVGKVVY